MRRFFWRRAAVFCCAALFSLLFFSCIGVVSRITLNQDGSGRLQLEYRIARELESMGKLDGNEKWPPVPVGRADLERSAARVPGLSLVSYTSRQAGTDTIHSAEFSFASLEALSAFFDSQGQRFMANLSEKRMAFAFQEQANANPEFQELLKGALEGYGFSLSLTVPGQVSTAWLDKEGKTIHNFTGNCFMGNNTVEYTVPMAQLIFLDASQIMEVRW